MKRMMAVGLCLLLAACADPDDKAASSVADYLPDALSQPMPVLYDKALKGDGDDWLKFGLALAAGRPSSAVVSDADQARLAVLDVRLRVAKREWLKENPPDSLDMVPWDYQINLSQEDATLIWQADQKFSADYWLSRAEEAKNMRTILMYSATRFGGEREYPLYVSVPAIDDKILLAAAVCAAAVRKRAGLTAVVVPEVVRRLRNRHIDDIEAKLIVSQTSSHVAGASACGSQATFSRYVGLLKAANP